MGSPRTSFVGLPLATLNQIQTELQNQLLYGQVSSESAGQKSEGRIYSDPAQSLIDVRYAIQLATNALQPNIVVNRTAGCGHGL
jgi:hypothetical protein